MDFDSISIKILILLRQIPKKTFPKEFLQPPSTPGNENNRTQEAQTLMETTLPYDSNISF